MKPKHYDPKPYIVMFMIILALVVFFMMHYTRVYDAASGNLGPDGITLQSSDKSLGSTGNATREDNGETSLNLIGDDSSPDVMSVIFAAAYECITDPFNFNGLVLAHMVIPLSAVLALMGFIIFIYYEDMKLHKQDIPGGEGGTAHWNTDYKSYEKEYTCPWTKKDIKEGIPDNNIILSKNLKLSMNDRAIRRNLNSLVVGGSGTGKTYGLIKPNIAQMNCSYLVTDPSGEIFESVGQMMLKNGYNVRLFSTSDMKHSNSYNPMDYIYNEDGEVDSTKVDILVSTFIRNADDNAAKGKGDQFWVKSSTAYMRFAVLFLAEFRSQEERNMYQILRLTKMGKADEGASSSSSKTMLDHIVDDARKKNPMAKCFSSYDTFKLAPAKTANSILISLAVDLEKFSNEDVRNMTSTSYICTRNKQGLVKNYKKDKDGYLIKASDNLDLYTIGDEKTVVFINIPQANSTFDFLVSMMYSQLFDVLYSRAEKICANRYHIYDKHGFVLSSEYKSEEEAKRVGKLYANAEIVTEEEKDGSKKYFIYNKDAKKEDTIPEKAIDKKTYGYLKEVFSEEVGNKLINSYKEIKIKRGAKRLPIHTRFLLDEFANIGAIPAFERYVATMRKYQISVMIILQSFAQIKEKYEKQWEVLVGNCDTIIFLGSSENDTDKYMSEKLGKATIRTIDESQSKSSTSGSTSESFKKQARELLSQAEIAQINNDDCIICIRGLAPFYEKKAKFVEHPNYGMTGDCKPEQKVDGQYLEEHYKCSNKLREFTFDVNNTETMNRDIKQTNSAPDGSGEKIGRRGKPARNKKEFSEAVGSSQENVEKDMKKMMSVEPEDYRQNTDPAPMRVISNQKNNMHKTPVEDADFPGMIPTKDTLSSFDEPANNKNDKKDESPESHAPEAKDTASDANPQKPAGPENDGDAWMFS